MAENGSSAKPRQGGGATAAAPNQVQAMEELKKSSVQDKNRPKIEMQVMNPSAQPSSSSSPSQGISGGAAEREVVCEGDVCKIVPRTKSLKQNVVVVSDISTPSSNLAGDVSEASEDSES